MAIDKITTPAIADGAVSADTLTSTVITGQTAETSIATDDLILLSDTSASGALKKMTRANFVSGVGGVMTPAFAASLSGTQGSISDNTRTKVQYNTEIFDSSGAYDNSTNYRFTPQTAGKYFVYASLSLFGGANNRYEYGFIYIQKNTTDIAVAGDDLRDGKDGRWFTPSTSTIVDMNGSSDYLEVDGIIGVSSGTGTFYGDNHFSTFGAYRIIE